MKNELELLAGVRNGALDDFAPIVQRYQALVFSIVGRYERDVQKVEDLAQETFLKAWRALEQYDPRKGPFANWLSRIAIHIALDHLRKQQRIRNEVQWTTLGESAEEWLQSSDSEPRPQADDAREILALAMQQLNAEEQLVITLLEIEEKSVKAISQLTGWSGVTVRVRAYRARGKLRQALEQLQRSGRDT